MRYRKIDPRFWNDEKVRALSDDGKLALLFVMTHPHLTALGAMRATLDGLASELGWSARRFKKAAEPAIHSGILLHDARSSFIGLPNFLRYNEPEGPNSVKAWRDALDRIPECPNKAQLMARCRAYLAEKSKPFLDAIGDTSWLTTAQENGQPKADAIRDAMPDAIGDAPRGSIPDPGAGAGAGTGRTPPTPPSSFLGSEAAPDRLPAGVEDQAPAEQLTPEQARARVSDLVAQATRAAPDAPSRRAHHEPRERTLGDAIARGQRLAAHEARPRAAADPGAPGR